jgi:hypothetical protein
MDEAAFRAARPVVTGDACVFERALLARCAGCSHAVPHSLAERETIGCDSPAARARCDRYLRVLRERAAFALKRTPASVALPHALAVRLACGGLAGLAQALHAPGANDVHGLLAEAELRYGDFADVPWTTVAAAVAAWHGRRRHGATR